MWQLEDLKLWQVHWRNQIFSLDVGRIALNHQWLEATRADSERSHTAALWALLRILNSEVDGLS